MKRVEPKATMPPFDERNLSSSHDVVTQRIHFVYVDRDTNTPATMAVDMRDAADARDWARQKALIARDLYAMLYTARYSEVDIAPLYARIRYLENLFRSALVAPDETVNAVVAGAEKMSAGAYKVRVHVPAFTYETTIRELALARQDPATLRHAVTKADEHGLHRMTNQRLTIANEVWRAMHEKMLDSDNVLESCQPLPTEQEIVE